MSVILSNCGGRNQDQETNAADSVIYLRDTLSLETDATQPGSVKNNLMYIIDYHEKTISKNPEAINDSYTLDSVIVYLNNRYPRVIIEKLKKGHDTLYTTIRDSEALGEQMGTTGAGEYFATAVLNLTALPGVRYVKIDMKEHSHASPGIFTRNDFNDFREIGSGK
ncbi:MAG: hypothetical protein ABIQ56_03545 [Chitinophagaceae bacterium]